MSVLQNKKVLVLSDSFKSTLTSEEIGLMWKEKYECDFLPLSDGGEGTLDTLLTFEQFELKLINGYLIAIKDQTAYVEVAKIVGYDNINGDVYNENTVELGNVLKSLIELDIKRIAVFIGGTKTNDMGLGILSAFGWKFLDEKGSEIIPVPKNFKQITKVITTELPKIEIDICSDVENALVGINGATYVFGPQKGISNPQEIDKEINRIAKLINYDNSLKPGSGAGGGIGYGLYSFNAVQQNGFDYIAKLHKLETKIQDYDLIITGEGKLDNQTKNGKLPYKINQLCKKLNKECIGVFGQIEDFDHAREFTDCIAIAKSNVSSSENMLNAKQNYLDALDEFANDEINTILFDLDGVICDTAILHYRAWRKLANELGGDITEEFNEQLKGVDRAESLRRILDEINVSLNDKDFNYYMNWKNDVYVEMLEEITEADILPGISQFLNECKNLKFKLAIASASRNAPVILDKLGILNKFDQIADPSKVENNKPAPDIFELAAYKSNSLKKRCIGIEDSQAGINALNAANIKSVAIGNQLVNCTIKLSDTTDMTIKTIV